MFSFLNPLALFGLIAAALPLVIHLLSRWRTRTIDFSSLMLLRKVQSRNVRRLRTRQWLLLLLRTLIIALLVLVPARPVVRGLLSSGPRDHLPVEAMIVADISASTGYVDSRGQAFNLLVGRIDSLLGWLNPADRYRIIRADSDIRSGDTGWRSTGVASGMDNDIAPGYGSTSLAGVLETVAGMFSAGSEYEREIYLFTDRQRGFLGADSLAVDTTLGVCFYLVGIHQSMTENTSVSSIGLPGELVRPGAPLEVTLQLERTGGDSLVNLFPRVYLDGRLVGQGESSLEADQAGVTVAEIPPLEPGYHELAAEIDADPLAADNRRSMVVDVPAVSRVVLVERGIPGGPDYLATALEVLANSRAGAVRFRRAAALPVSPAEVGDADVYIVHGLDHPQQRLNSFLAEIRRQGRHALFVPRSGGPPPSAFNDATARLELPLAHGGLSGLGQGSFDTPQPGLSTESGSVFDRLFESITGLSRARLFSIRGLEQPEAGGAVWDVRTRGGRIWLRMARLGGANIMLSTTDLGSADETELPGTPLFVPLVHSLITMLAHDGPLMQQSATVGEPVTIYFGAPVNTNGMEVHGPEGARYFLPPGERASWMFENTDTPGAYWLYHDGELAGGFGVGLAPPESDVRLEDEQTIRRAFGAHELHLVPGGSDLAGGVLQGRGGVEVWPWLLIAALVLLGVEQVVANRRREED